MALASAVMDIARAKLNDIPGDVFTNEVLLPHLQSAWRTLQSSMQSNGIPTVRKQSATLTIPAGNLVISSSSIPPYPSDFIEPIELWERKVGGQVQDWTKMFESDWSPFVEQTESLRIWAWVDQEIQFPGATEDREVQIRYLAKLAEITSENTNIPVIFCEEYLGTKTAALAAEFIGANRTRSDRLESMAEIELRMFINKAVKGMQAIKTRRIPYGNRRRRLGWLPLPN